MADEVQACLAAGMDAHLGKPVDRAGLLSMVRRTIAEAGAQPRLSGAA
jgi:CheY-like chemotaxis protein